MLCHAPLESEELQLRTVIILFHWLGSGYQRQQDDSAHHLASGKAQHPALPWRHQSPTGMACQNPGTPTWGQTESCPSRTSLLPVPLEAAIPSPS